MFYNFGDKIMPLLRNTKSYLCKLKITEIKYVSR